MPNAWYKGLEVLLHVVHIINIEASWKNPILRIGPFILSQTLPREHSEVSMKFKTSD